MYTLRQKVEHIRQSISEYVSMIPENEKSSYTPEKLRGEIMVVNEWFRSYNLQDREVYAIVEAEVVTYFEFKEGKNRWVTR